MKISLVKGNQQIYFHTLRVIITSFFFHLNHENIAIPHQWRCTARETAQLMIASLLGFTYNISQYFYVYRSKNGISYSKWCHFPKNLVKINTFLFLNLHHTNIVLKVLLLPLKFNYKYIKLRISYVSEVSIIFE